MGLSIHYSGRINPEASLQHLIREVKDTARIYEWKYTVFEEQFPQNSFNRQLWDRNLYGITISPPECEPVFVSFLSNGRMAGPLQLASQEDDTPQDRDYLYTISVKTQYAGPEIHKIIVNLLHYLSKKYLKEFSMHDEGQYWETGDEAVLHQQFKRYQSYLNSFTSALNDIPMQPGETYEAYFERLLQIIHNRKNNG